MQTDNGAICLLPWNSVAIRAGGRAEPCSNLRLTLRSFEAIICILFN